MKFGRVRFKVIMMKNEADGEQVYQIKPSGSLKKRLASKASLDNTDSENEMDQEDHDLEA